MYTPLKVTTDYTLLESLIKIEDLINFCVTKKINTVGVCDKNLFSSISFYKLCKKNNIKPIIGLHLIINNLDIYLYAMNYNGYKNLLKINNSIYDNTLNIDIVKKYIKDNIIVIPFKSKDLYDEFKKYKYTYISYENSNELKEVEKITNNVIYINDIRVYKDSDNKYLKYLNKLGDIEYNGTHNYFDAISISEYDQRKINEFVNLINIEIPFNNRYMPKYSNDSFNLLCELCKKGLTKRLNGNVSKEYVERLKYELSVINKMGYVDYFLIVYDYVLYAKKNDIFVGPGRGSAAGSLVSYSIGITDIDPLEYNLLFERFLNPDRVSMPDIDIDFDSVRRDEVIEYVKNKYGDARVSQGLTFTTLKTRLVLRDVAKLFNIDEKLLNKFFSVIDKDKTLKENLDNKYVKEYLNSYSNLKNVYDISLKLEGLKKNFATHASEVIISDRDLDEIIPMYKNESTYLAGVEKENLEEIGLLKMDFLGVINLHTIKNITEKIPNFNFFNMPLDDKKTYELLCSADTDGIFQLETNSFKNVLPKFKPKTFNELVALVSLVRPGPSRELEKYIKRKEGLEKIDYYHDNLKDILEETYGVIIYQEQVMSILVKMANFSYADADNVRRAMAKKKEKIILEYKDTFIKRSLKNGYSNEIINHIFDNILAFSDYGFNKSHAVSYATITYEMAYLKANYKDLFIIDALNNNKGNIDKVKGYLNELKKSKYIVMGVDINKSGIDYYIEDNRIYLPFKSIKNINADTINTIINNRSYEDIYDFFKKTNSTISKKEYELLIKANSLKSFNYNINTLLNNIDELINYGEIANSLLNNLKPEIEIYEELDKKELRKLEIDIYGMYINNHPTSIYNCNKLENIKSLAYKKVVCYIVVDNIHKIKTKKGEDMAFISGSDETGECDFTVFPEHFNKLNGIEKNDIVKVEGNVSKRFDKYSVIVNNIIKE